MRIFKAIQFQEEYILNLTDVHTVKALCREFGFGTKKKFGQNFITDEKVPDIISDTAKGMCALEIGPGLGTLTEALCRKCEKVVSVEIDTSLEKLLGLTVGNFTNLRVVFSDIMKTDIAALCKEEFTDRKVCVCANLPYYVTSPVLLRLMDCGFPFESITVMVQKEVADRLCAKPGTPEYGAITLTCQRYGRPVKLTDVPRTSFYPVPGVDSAVVSIISSGKENIFCKDEELLTKVIRASFNQRRKTLVNALYSGIGRKTKEEYAKLLVSCGFSADVRGEKLSLSDFAKIVNNM